MRVIKPSFEVEMALPFEEKHVLAHLERVGRTCYKSEDRITEESGAAFIRMLLNRGHEAMVEHFSFTFRIVCDRGVSHELVRHRIASYAQESTRYCNYSHEKFGRELTFIQPVFFDTDSEKYRMWEMAMRDAEMWYFTLLDLGAKPEEARDVLPTSVKTEIVMTMNIRELREFFKLRVPSTAHPQMREITHPMLRWLITNFPILFGDMEALYE